MCNTWLHQSPLYAVGGISVLVSFLCILASLCIFAVVGHMSCFWLPLLFLRCWMWKSSCW